ncbi:transposase [Haloglycomyces albus]|uniref:transposase n=1 Tax=Haloglycomyces albus TaxID=526067 RepID=UPI0012EB8F02|nr:transposase [Haloglycomyces albus]
MQMFFYQNGRLSSDWNVDGTSIRAHHHAAGAHHVAVEGEPGDHGIGRSRGGLTTKIHAVTDTNQNVLSLTISPGQAHDSLFLCPC